MSFTLGNAMNMTKPGKIDSTDLTISTGEGTPLGRDQQRPLGNPHSRHQQFKSQGNGTITFNGPVVTNNLTAVEPR